MKKFFKRLLGLLVVLIVAIGLFLFLMRFHDGPLAIVAGGPFETGELAAAPDDWSFLTNEETIEFQTLEPARSRTVWLAVHEGRLFIISGYMTTTYGAIWKQWPHYLEEDDRIILRIDGNLYEQRLQRINAGPIVAPVMAEFARKYFPPEAEVTASQVTEGHSWLYEVVDR